MSSGRSSGCARIGDHVTNGETQAVGERCVEAGALRWTLHDERIHVPVFGLVQGVGPQCIERQGEILAETPTVGRTVVIDDTDLIVTETIDAVFAQKELRVLNEEITDLRLGEIEDEAAGVSLVAEVAASFDGHPPPAGGRRSRGFHHRSRRLRD